MNIDQMIAVLRNAALRHPALLQHVPVYEAMRGLDMAEVLRVGRFLEVAAQRMNDVMVVRTQMILGDPVFFRIANIAFAQEIRDGSVIVQVSNIVIHNEIIIFRRNAPVGNPARALLDDELAMERFMYGNDGVDGRAREAPQVDPEPVVAYAAPIIAEAVQQPNLIQNNNNIRNGNNRRNNNIQLPRELYNLLVQNRVVENVPNMQLLQQIFNEMVEPDTLLLRRLVALDVPAGVRDIVVRLLPGINIQPVNNLPPQNIVNPVIDNNVNENLQEVVAPLVPAVVHDAPPIVQPPNVEPALHPEIRQVLSPSKNKVETRSTVVTYSIYLHRIIFGLNGMYFAFYLYFSIIFLQILFTYSRFYYIKLLKFTYSKILLMFYTLYMKHFSKFIEKILFKYIVQLVVTYHNYIYFLLPHGVYFIYLCFAHSNEIYAPLDDEFLIPHKFSPNKHINMIDPFSSTDLIEFGYKSVASISIYNEMLVYLRNKNIPCSLTGERARIMMHLANEWYIENKFILPCDHNIMVNTVKHTCVIVEITQKRLFRELGTNNSGVANITL